MVGEYEALCFPLAKSDSVTCFLLFAQALWLVEFHVKDCGKPVIVMGTSGGAVVAAKLAQALIDKGVVVVGIVALSGTPDPEQVCSCNTARVILHVIPQYSP